MAKRGALEHPKTMELAAILEIDDCFALGILEAFWHHVARYFPAGDVSTAKPHLLTRSIRYGGDAAQLWQALIEAGFVDQLEDGRQIIHDWSEHADDAVHMALARKGLLFADGSRPRMTRLSTVERARAEELYAQHGAQPTHAVRVDAQESAGCAHTVRTAIPSHAPPEPEASAMPEPESIGGSQATPPVAASHSRSKPLTDPEGAEPAWQEFLAIYPMRNGDRKPKAGHAKFLGVLRSGVPPDVVLEGAGRYRAWCDANGKTRTELVQQIPTWLNNAGWEQEWTVFPRGSGRPGAGGVDLTEERDRILRDLRGGNGNAHGSDARSGDRSVIDAPRGRAGERPGDYASAGGDLVFRAGERRH